MGQFYFKVTDKQLLALSGLILKLHWLLIFVLVRGVLVKETVFSGVVTLAMHI